MANLIERKRRRRRKIVYLESNQLLNHQTREVNSDLILRAAQSCESQNGIEQLQQLCRLQPEHQQPASCGAPKLSSYTRRRTGVRLTSAIHIMAQNLGCYHYRSGPSSSLYLLLLISVAFTFTLSSLLPPNTNLILLTEASGNNNNQQQQSQPQPGGPQANSFGVGNSVIGDRPTTTGGGGKARYKTMYACEDRQLTMDCDFGSKINLIRANYGRFSITQCNEQGQLDLSTDCMSPITFRIMRERCQDKQKCSVNATSAIFGDKCPKTRKYLEVHFQCQSDPRTNQPFQIQQHQPSNGFINNEQPDRVDLRNSSQLASQTPTQNMIYPGPSSSTLLLPPNNPPITNQYPPTSSPSRQPSVNTNVEEFPITVHMQQQQQTVMNSEMLDYNTIANSRANGISSADDREIIVTLRHSHIENMSNPRCVSWDPVRQSWTQVGSRIIETNLTHTICAYEQATSYMLVMDHHLSSSPNPTISSQTNQPLSLPTITHLPVPSIGSPDQRFLETQPTPLDMMQPPPDSNNSKVNSPSSSSSSQSSLVRFFSLFGYMLAIVFVAIAFITIAFVASTMRTSGTSLKSLGNFSAFGGPKYKNRRADEGLHNKDLLVINNQNGHQFLYAPASATKIQSPTSTHILPGGLANQHQGTLQHQIQQQQLQQQQMYSGNGTLSNLSGTGGQSNYYYGLMGSLFQQQQHQSQLQHHLSTHHLNQQQQHQMQQGLQAANYQHQANKSTISNESSNSTPSSSGVESASTSLHQHQQQQQPQSCLMLNSEYNLMGQVNNYNQHQTLLSSHLYQHQQPQLTLNAHYSSSGPPMTMGQQQQQQNRQMMMNNNSQLLREHIYESVDDDKQQQCMSRGGMLLPVDQSEQLFGSNTLSEMSQVNSNQQQQQANLNRAMTLSSRLLQNAIQQQQQQSINSSQTNKRLLSHPAIVRDNQQTKTNIICSKLAQVTPQRATEVNKFQHDIMAIFNQNDTTTTTTATGSPSATGFCRSADLNDLAIGSASGNGKARTDC